METQSCLFHLFTCISIKLHGLTATQTLVVAILIYSTSNVLDHQMPVKHTQWVDVVRRVLLPKSSRWRVLEILQYLQYHICLHTYMVHTMYVCIINSEYNKTPLKFSLASVAQRQKTF